MLASALTSLPNTTGIDLPPDPAEVALAPPLIAQRQHHAGLAAGLGDGAAVRDAVGDRLVEETCLPAAAAARVVARCTSFGVVLMIASISVSASIAS